MPAASFWPLPAPIVRQPAGPLAPHIGMAGFLDSLLALMPRGRAWPRDPDSTMVQVLTGLAAAQADLHGLQVAMLAETRPDTTNQMLSEWEASLGLPDDCLGMSPTVQQRQAQVVARFKADGGQTVDYLVEVAKNLGFVVTIDRYRAFRANSSRAGQNLRNPRQAIPETVFRANSGRAGDPLVVWGAGYPGSNWDTTLRITCITEPVSVFRAGSHAGERLMVSSGVATAVPHVFRCGYNPRIAGTKTVLPPPVSVFRCGSRAGDRLAVFAPVKLPVSHAGDHLRSVHNRVLECELRRVAPAQLNLIFAYQG